MQRKLEILCAGGGSEYLLIICVTRCWWWIVDTVDSCHTIHATLTFRRWRAPQPPTNKCKDHSSNLESLENYRIIELTPHLWSAPAPAPAGPGPSICLAELLLQAQISPARNCRWLNQNNLVEDPKYCSPRTVTGVVLWRDVQSSPGPATCQDNKWFLVQTNKLTFYDKKYFTGHTFTL